MSRGDPLKVSSVLASLADRCRVGPANIGTGHKTVAARSPGQFVRDLVRFVNAILREVINVRAKRAVSGNYDLA